MAPSINAGDLNRRISIRLWTDIPNVSLGLDQTFGSVLTRWAKREPVHSLAIRGDMNTTEAPTDLFWVRRGAGTKPEEITVSHVVEFEGRRYRVLDTIDVDDMRCYTRIATKDIGKIR